MIGKLYKPIDIGSGTIIMAMGIFLLGTIHQFSYIEKQFEILFGIVFTVWIIFIFKLIYSFLNVKFAKQLYNQPIQSFALGTWIVATSLITILIYQLSPNFIGIKFLVYINCFAWIVYLIFAVFQLIKIVKLKLIQNVNGVILLTTVSTQSIACLLIATFHHTINVIIALGALLYILSLSLIFIRFKIKGANLHEWKNTDCIIHGALSITGLAMTLSNNFEIHTLLIIWFVAFGLFCSIEIVEILRCISRVKLYGIKKGVFVYHTTQWARNLTFGTFYYFTFNLISYIGETDEMKFQSHILTALGWVILVLLIIEIILWIVPSKKLK